MSNIQTGLRKVFNAGYALMAKTPLKRIPGAWKFSNLVFKLISPNTDVVEIQGSKMVIDLCTPDLEMRKTFQSYAMNMIHEPETTELFNKTLKSGDVFVDFGANIGYFTLLAAKIVGPSGKVFSFEPEPKNFSYLTRNIALNGYNSVSAYQKAVSNKDGKTKLYVCGYDSGHHTINSDKGIDAYRHGRTGETTEIEVDTVALDTFLRDKTSRVDVMKIDAEGAEVLAIEGMHNLLESNRHIKVFMEFFPLLIKSMGSSPEALFEYLLSQAKFDIYIIGQDYDMQGTEKFTRITSYQELDSHVRAESDHLNLFLTRDQLAE